MNGIFARTERLVGADGLSKLQATHVILFLIIAAKLMVFCQ